MKKLNRYSILVVVDNKKSSLNQAMGLAKSIKKKNKEIIIELFDSAFIKYKALPNLLIYSFLKISNKIPFEFFLNINLIISCGRIAAPISLIFKEKLGCQNIHINDPYFKRDQFNKIIIPKHDNPKKLENKIEAFGSITCKENKNISLKNIIKLKQVINFKSKKKIVTILIGGSSKSSNFSEKDLIKLNNLLGKINLRRFQLAFVFSRRTPKFVKKSINKKYKSESYIWDELSLNPYWYLINISDFFIVSSDSVSMTSEALLSGKPVFTFKLKKMKNKIYKFHQYLENESYIREFNGEFFSWKYNEFDEGKRIAEIIKVELNI